MSPINIAWIFSELSITDYCPLRPVQVVDNIRFVLIRKHQLLKHKLVWVDIH